MSAFIPLSNKNRLQGGAKSFEILPALRNQQRVGSTNKGARNSNENANGGEQPTQPRKTRHRARGCRGSGSRRKRNQRAAAAAANQRESANNTARIVLQQGFSEEGGRDPKNHPYWDPNAARRLAIVTDSINNTEGRQYPYYHENKEAPPKLRTLSSCSSSSGSSDGISLSTSFENNNPNNTNPQSFMDPNPAAHHSFKMHDRPVYSSLTSSALGSDISNSPIMQSFTLYNSHKNAQVPATCSQSNEGMSYRQSEEISTACSGGSSGQKHSTYHASGGGYDVLPPMPAGALSSKPRHVVTSHPALPAMYTDETYRQNKITSNIPQNRQWTSAESTLEEYYKQSSRNQAINTTSAIKTTKVHSTAHRNTEDRNSKKYTVCHGESFDYRLERIKKQRGNLSEGGSLFQVSPRSFLLGRRRQQEAAIHHDL